MNFYRSSPTQPRAMPSGWLLVLALLALAALLLPGMAHATDLFAVPAGDKSKTLFLDKIFGDFTNSPLAGPVGVFNSAILFVGGILAAYTIIAGTMSTAHDGEMLGKKWSSMWIPIRTAIGTAAILPVMNGFCVAQSIVLWMATQGVGLADAVWNQFAANPIQTMSVTTAGINDKVTGMALAMLQDNVCLQSYQKNSTANSSAAQATGGSSFPEGTYSANPTNTTTPAANGAPVVNTVGYNYGQTTTPDAESGLQYTLCGSVSLDVSTGTAVTSTGIGSVDELSNGAPAAASGISAAHQAQFTAMQASMASAATSFLANPTSFNALGAAVTAATTYEQGVASAANAAANDPSLLTAFRQDVQTDGWAYAGAWYMKLIRIQDGINNAVNRTPSLTSPQGETGTVDADVLNDLKSLHNSVTKAAGAQSPGGLNAAALLDMKDEGNSHWWSAISNWASRMTKIGDAASTALVNPDKAVSGYIGGFLDSISDLNDPTKNGLLAAKGVGDNLIAVGWGIAVLAGVVGVFSAAAGLAIFSFAFMLWSTGAGLSIVLPMTPYLMWVGIMIGWVILVVEAVFAAPLWAVVHLHPDGDGVVGRGGTGYMLVLSLTLRPSLMVLGLISAIVLMDPITYFLNTTFFGAFRLMQGNTTTGAVTFVALAMMYCTSMFMVIKKTFALIHIIPDQIMNWIGNGGPALGQNATEAAQSATEGHRSGLQNIARIGQVASGTASGIATMKRQNAANKEQERTTAAQERGNFGDRQDRFNDSANDARLSAQKAAAQDPENRQDYMNIAANKMERAIQDGQKVLDSGTSSKGQSLMSEEERKGVQDEIQSLSDAKDALKDGSFGQREPTVTEKPSDEAPAEPSGPTILGADGQPLGGSGRGGRGSGASAFNSDENS